MKKIIGIFILLVALLSCSNDKLVSSKDTSQSGELTNQQVKALVNLKEDKKLEQSEVESRVLDFVNNLNESQSRSGEYKQVFISSTKKEIIESYVEITSNSRAADSIVTEGNEEIELYAFDLTDSNNQEAGFVIASGDERFPAVLAYSENGSLKSDIEDDFLFSFVDRLPDYINKTLAEYNTVSDEDINSALERVETMDVTSSSRSGKVVEKYGPLVPVQWGQGAPYSDVINKVKKDSGLLSGCVAIAISQIMASHKHATGGTYNWNKMTSKSKAYYLDSSTKNMISTLIYRVAEAVHMNYGKKGSGANSKYADDCFDKMGYRTPSSLQGYNFDLVKRSVKNGNAVYTAANAKKEIKKKKIFGITVSKKTIYSEGHAYVIDGYTKKIVRVTIPIFGKKKTIDMPFNYFHVNLGWGGYKNGYYAAGTFDTNAGPSFTRSGTSGNYQYNIRILPNVSPK